MKFDGPKVLRISAVPVVDVVKGALGVAADEFIDLKIKEWETYDRQVTPWEIDEYLTFL
jgi:glutamine synthetase